MLSDKTDDQLQEVWTYFNVVSVDKFVFTRCVECNGNSYIQFSGKIALVIAENLTGENKDDSGKCPINEEEKSLANNCDVATLDKIKGKHLSMLPFYFIIAPCP